MPNYFVTSPNSIFWRTAIVNTKNNRVSANGDVQDRQGNLSGTTVSERIKFYEVGALIKTIIANKLITDSFVVTLEFDSVKGLSFTAKTNPGGE